MATFPPPMTSTFWPSSTLFRRAESLRKSTPFQNTRQVFARHIQPAAHVQARGHKNGFKSVRFEAVQRDIFAKGGRRFLMVTPQRFYGFHFRFDNVSRQPVCGNSHSHHAPHHGEFFKYRDRVPAKRQKIGGGKSRQAPAPIMAT